MLQRRSVDTFVVYKRLDFDRNWDRNSLSQANAVGGVTSLINKDIVRDSISKMKNGKATGSSVVVSEMVKETGEAGTDLIANLVNQIIVEGVIPAEWERHTIVSCC